MDTITTIKEFLMYQKIERGASPLTLSCYKRDLEAFTKHLQRKDIRELKEIDTPLLRQYFIEIQQAYNYKTNTICRKINCMRSFFNYCQDQEYIISNPTRRIKAPKKERLLPIYLTDEEAKRFIETPTKDKLMVTP